MNYLALVDTHTTGNRYDVTPLFAEPAAFAALVADLVQPFDAAAVDQVAGIDALGFILGAAVAWHWGKGFVPVRKGGRLPVAADEVAFVDYTGRRKRLALRRGALRPGARVLLVDEWVETGAQMSAAAALLERAGGVIIGLAAICIDDGPRTRALRARYHCHSVWKEPEA